MNEQTTALARANTGNLDEVQRTARMLAVSGYFDVHKDMTVAIAQMATKILAGAEMGYGPFASVQGIHVIQGKPSVSANLMASAVKNHPRYDYRVRTLTNTECEIEFFEIVDGKRESLGKSRFDETDAKSAGLSGKDIWKKHPKNMLFARAMSNGVRFYTPDIFAGNVVYAPEEMGADVDDSGNFVESTARVVDQTTGEIMQQETTAVPEPSRYAAVADRLTGNCHKFLIWARGKHLDGGPCSDEQYRYVVGVINDITGVPKSHNAVLSAITGWPISSANVPGWKMASDFLKYLPETKMVDEVKVANPDYRQDYTDCIRRIHECCNEVDGQQVLIAA